MRPLLLLLTFVFIGFTLFAQEKKEFVVQLAAYETPVNSQYFSAFPDEDIFVYKDHHNIYHYFFNDRYSTENEASSKLTKAKAKFPNSVVFDLGKLKDCSICCNPDNIAVYEKPLGKVFVDVPAPPTVVQAPPKPVNDCNLPDFELRNQEDFERVRTVLKSNPGARLYILNCAKSKQLTCYLSLRNAAYCGMQTYTRSELSQIIDCPSLTSCVYIMDSSNNPIDISMEFKRLASY